MAEAIPANNYWYSIKVPIYEEGTMKHFFAKTALERKIVEVMLRDHPYGITKNYGDSYSMSTDLVNKLFKIEYFYPEDV